jgi:hypothetical protein
VVCFIFGFCHCLDVMSMQALRLARVSRVAGRLSLLDSQCLRSVRLIGLRETPHAHIKFHMCGNIFINSKEVSCNVGFFLPSFHSLSASAVNSISCGRPDRHERLQMTLMLDMLHSRFALSVDQSSICSVPSSGSSHARNPRL